MTSPLLIQITNLSVRFGKEIVHNKLNLDIYQGEILGIVGGSGSGKSVLLRIIAGLGKPTSGKITYFTDPPYPSTQIGFLFQQGALISSLTVAENITAPMLEIAKISPTFAYELALIKLDMVGLSPETAFKYPAQLSGGMIKRVALARALALDPEILFLDEPTAGLDPISASAFDQLIKKLQQNLKITVVMVTHDLDSLMEICNRVAVLVDHNVVSGTLEEVSSVDNPWIHKYFYGARGQRLFTNQTRSR